MKKSTQKWQLKTVLAHAPWLREIIVQSEPILNGQQNMEQNAVLTHVYVDI